MNRLNEEIRRNRELMGLQEQVSPNARSIGYSWCNGNGMGTQNNITTNGNVPMIGDILTIDTNYYAPWNSSTEDIRTVYVTTVNPTFPGYQPQQDPSCETVCAECQDSNCFNWTTGQPCSACDNDPDCWHDNSQGGPGGGGVPCDGCGCQGTPAVTQVYGCTNGPGPGTQPGSPNYDPNATCDDGSCIPVPDDWLCFDNNTCTSVPGGAVSNWQQYPNILGIYTSETDCLTACGQTTSGSTSGSTSSCAVLTQPIGGSNWQQNVQTHGWETTFTCLIENANNPCSLLRKKIDDMNAQLQKPFFQNNSTHYDRVTQHIAFAQNLGNNPHDCDNLENLSPGDDTNLTGGSMNWNKPQWESEFTDTVSNHANPCNFLQNRITAWETKLTTISEWSTAWIEMLEFKIEHAESLQSTNNC